MKKTPNDSALHHLGQAIGILGGQSALARACGVKQGHVWHWLNKSGKCPAGHVISIEEATGGKVTRQQLRPDLYPLPGTKPPAAKAKRRKKTRTKKAPPRSPSMAPAPSVVTSACN